MALPSIFDKIEKFDYERFFARWNIQVDQRQATRGVWIGVITAVCLATFFGAGSAGFLKNAEEWFRDVQLGSFIPYEPQNEDIVVVGVNEQTLDSLPYRSPLQRSFIADIIKKLDAAGVRAIGIDYLFDSESKDTEGDAKLREAIASARAVVMPIWVEDSQMMSYWKVDNMGDKEKRTTTLKSFLGDRPTGFGEVYKDRNDSVVRRFRTIWKEDTEVQWHFTAAMARALGYDIKASTKLERIDWHGHPDPTTEEGYVPPFRAYPAHVVAKFPVLPPAWFKDKIVLFGPVLSEMDRHKTALTTVNLYGDVTDSTPGVVIHAHVLSQLIEGRTLGDVPLWVRIVQALLIIAFGISLSMTRAIPLWVKNIVIATTLLAFAGLSVVVFRTFGSFLPTLPAQITLFVAVGFTTFVMGREERQQKAFIRGAFSKMVPESVVARLDKNPAQLKLGGERKEITLVFTDMEGFTSTSEGLTPAQIGEVMSDYLDGMSRVIMEHEGTIDKFIGDGTMSFFGAPESSGDDADRAVACAIHMFDFDKEFCARWHAKGIMVGRTRIGIHTGLATVGNFGGEERFNYTALGDVVNTSARLEAANKVTRTRALVSEETVEKTSKDSHFRPVGDLIMPGKKEAIRAYEPVTDDDFMSDFFTDYMTAFDLLDKEDPKAVTAFERLAEERPKDGLIALHLERLRKGETGRVIHIKSK